LIVYKVAAWSVIGPFLLFISHVAIFLTIFRAKVNS
jgi:hypothetical protein